MLRLQRSQDDTGRLTAGLRAPQEAHGDALSRPSRRSTEGNARRAIDIHAGEEVDESAFKALFSRAVALNSSGKSKPSKKAQP
jgi:hypothetical protein